LEGFVWGGLFGESVLQISQSKRVADPSARSTSAVIFRLQLAAEGLIDSFPVFFLLESHNSASFNIPASAKPE
jgi:hypothetical protein